MAVEVYVNFDGNCKEAVDFYGQVFGSTPHIMTFGDAPPDPNHPIPEESKSRVMHANLTVLGSRVMFSDTFPGMPFVEGNNVTLSLISDNVDELTALFNQLKVGGKVGMELQETFWSKCYGMVTDKFGIHWQVSHDSGEYNM